MDKNPQTMEQLLAHLDRVERQVLSGIVGANVRKLARINLPHRVHIATRPRVGHIRPLRPVRVLVNKGAPVRDVELSGELRAFIDGF